MEKTQPGIFHIHIDAKVMTRPFYDVAIKTFNFYESNFNGHPEGYEHFEPENHLTLKLFSKDDFHSTWSKLVEETNKHQFIGYLEGEYIPFDDYIPSKDYIDLPVPFKIIRRKISSGEKFRQTEIHVTFEKNKTNPDLVRKLLDAGMYGAYIPKKDGDFIVLTIQGSIKQIQELYPVLKHYLSESGGISRCTMKEERAIHFELYHIGNDDLPEVAEEVIYNLN